jgi:hypothetical protein
MPTLDASTPAAVYQDANTLGSLSTASFTPPAGSVVVAKVTCGDANTTAATPTGLTFTSRANVGTSGASARSAIFTAAGAGAAVTVSATFSGTGANHHLSVEVWTASQLATTPAVHTIVAGAGAPSDTLTTVAANSVVTWVNADWAAVNGTTRTYRSSAVETIYHFVTGLDTVYCAYQAAAAAGSQTYGLTAPVGQTFTMAAIEIQDSGAVATLPIPDLVMAPYRH